MNNKGFNRLLESSVSQKDLEAELGSVFKYLSLSEGVGAKTAGSELAWKALLNLNKSKEFKGEILTEQQVESLDYYFNKKKEIGKDPIEVVSINDKGKLDSEKIVLDKLKKLAKNSNIKSEVNAMIDALKANEKSSLKGKSAVDAATFVGTHLWRLSLLNKGREMTDGVGGVKQSVSYNDGINTMLLKQNFTYDPAIAAVIDKLGIDAITFDSAAKEYSKKQI
jgi:hypothetical protein